LLEHLKLFDKIAHLMRLTMLNQSLEVAERERQGALFDNGFHNRLATVALSGEPLFL